MRSSFGFLRGVVGCGVLARRAESFCCLVLEGFGFGVGVGFGEGIDRAGSENSNSLLPPKRLASSELDVGDDWG